MPFKLDSKANNESATQSNNISQGMKLQFPEGGGAYKGLDEKFEINPLTGACTFNIPLPFCICRHDFLPPVNVVYSSGNGNGILGMGWTLSVPSITRRTDNRLPKYIDEEESDVFVLDGYDDLVPDLTTNNSDDDEYLVKRYRPAIEKDFLRIEKYTYDKNVFWKVTTGNNIVTFYGLNENSRIYNPQKTDRIFKWLPEVSFDNLGNVMVYEYISEEDKDILGAMKYLKKIKYGNKMPFLPTAQDFIQPKSHAKMEYFYQVVFDYSDNRYDTISNYRPGFNLSINKLLKKILFYNNFDELINKTDPNPYLTKSVNFTYEYHDSNEEINACETDYIKEITYSYYTKNLNGCYEKESYEPLTFEYVKPAFLNKITQNKITLPEPLSTGWFFNDYYNEGIPGILNEYEGNLYYRKNIGEGLFSKSKQIEDFPSLKGINKGLFRLSELEPKGKKVLLSYKKEHPGFYEENSDKEWTEFKTFKSLPNIDLDGDNIYQLDLNGDGLSEIMVLEDGNISFYPSVGKDGFKDRLSGKFTGITDPMLIHKGTKKNVYIADMNGDGLCDIVRISNGEVCYWPNLGYGNFGKKIVFKNSPRFSKQETFAPSLLMVADITGTGACDLIYTGNGIVEVWVNYSGHSFSKVHYIDVNTNYYKHWKACDIYGKGTTVLVGHCNLSPAKDDVLYCIDLCGKEKPYLLNKYSNNLGKEVEIKYKSSVSDYLNDSKKGIKSASTLPFPVQCVDKVTKKDLVTGVKLTNSYKYRHGYYDGYNREFRGFGMVEEWDCEYDKNKLSQKPTVTRTWYHTGAYFEEKNILKCYESEYYNNQSDFEEGKLNAYDIQLSINKISASEQKDAVRALKGSFIRKETYFMDGSSNEKNPVEVVAGSILLYMLQHRNKDKKAVFNNVQREIIHYTYERDPAYPRVLEQKNLKFNEFGQVELSCVISWGNPPETIPNKCINITTKKHILFEKHDYTNYFDDIDCYRLREKCSIEKWELSIHSLNNFENTERLSTYFDNANIVDFYDDINSGEINKKKISKEKILYYNDDLTSALQTGFIGKKGIKFRSYILAYMNNHPSLLFDGDIKAYDLTNSGYIKEDNCWWIAGEKLIFSDNVENSFYLPIAIEDAFGNQTKVKYYNNYQLFPGEIEDMYGGKTRIDAYDFTLMLPKRIIDINNNIKEARYDLLGRIVGISLMGKGDEGDNFSDFQNYLLTSQIDDFFSDPCSQAKELLKGATQRYIYDFTSIPIKSAILSRDIHQKEETEETKSRIMIDIKYYDGFGRSVVKKTLSESEDTNLTWLTDEMHIYNNKGNPYKKYEPYFSHTHKFDLKTGFYDAGVSTIHLYDAIGRPTKTIFPDGTFEKTNITPWFVELYDRNDTVKESKWYHDRINGTLALDKEENKVAQKTVIHNNTPSLQYLDARGKNIYTVSHLKNEPSDDFVEGIRFTNDILGRITSITDVYDRESEKYIYDMSGRKISSFSLDSGLKKQFYDSLDRISYSIDSRNIKTKYSYDALSRILDISILEPNELEWKITHKYEYGDLLPNAELNNLRLKIVKCCDSAGILYNKVFDFKGNPILFSRKLCNKRLKQPDWSKQVDIESKEYEFFKTYNVMNQPIISSLPNGCRIIREYDITGKLKSIGQIISDNILDIKISNIKYNEKGQRTMVIYNNGVQTSYEYDPLNYRLSRIYSYRTDRENKRILQDIRYIYDPVGNISYCTDKAGKAVIFNGSVAKPEWEFTYDSLYRLTTSTGREHYGQNMPCDEKDLSRTVIPHPNDGSCMRSYVENYKYDLNGNITEIKHIAASSAYSWTRKLETNPGYNRLSTEQIGSITNNYQYDSSGNVISMHHLSALKWDHRGMLIETNVQDNSEISQIETNYWYDSEGHRTRKVSKYSNGIIKERIYLGEYEVFRQYSSDTLTKEKETILLSDDKKTFLETDIESSTNTSNTLERFRLDNHLNSSCMEVDENGSIISYEEYYAFGGTSLRCIKSMGIETKVSKYRYCNKERDEETGLYYYGLRYYAPWLGKWLSPDPAGVTQGMNPYVYAKNNPLRFNDPSGATDEDNTEQRENTQASDQERKKEDSDKKPEKVSVLGTILTSIQLLKKGTLMVLGFINGDDWLEKVKKVAGFIKDIWDSICYFSEDMYNLQEKALNWAKDKILEPVKNWFKKVWEKIKDFFSDTWDSIKSLFGASSDDNAGTKSSESGDESDERSWFDDVKNYIKDHFSLDFEFTEVALSFKFGNHEISFGASTDGLKFKGNISGYKFEYSSDYDFKELKYSYDGNLAKKSGSIKFENEKDKAKDFNTPFYWLNHIRDSGIRKLNGFSYNY